MSPTECFSMTLWGLVEMNQTIACVSVYCNVAISDKLNNESVTGMQKSKEMSFIFII